MPTEKRQRQKEARIARLEAERKAARRAAVRRRVITAVVIGVGVFAVLFLISVVGGDDDEPTDQAAGSTTTTAAGDTTATSLAPRQEKPEVTVPDPLPTELQITDITVGEGEEAQLGDSITVDYVGVSASTGEEFDASYDAEPATFPLQQGGLIEGWIQGIPGMRVGGRRQLVIPAGLGYGPEGNPPSIGPNETLVFIIDLLATARPATPPPPTPTPPG